MALAVREAGFELIGLCEIQPYCRRILKSHFEDVPIVEDVHEIGIGGTMPELNLSLLTGGFPIQANFSRGERRENDPRSLWSEFARVARETRPDWVVAETVPRFHSIGLDDAAWDMEREGYATTAFVLPAQAFGCPLRKDRLFLVAAKVDSARSLPGESGWLSRLEGSKWRDPSDRLCRVAEQSAGGLDEHTAALSAIGDASVPGMAGSLLRAIHDVEMEWQDSEDRKGAPTQAAS